MSNPGLTRRLRQQSHRSGLAVGISMALTVAICIAAFTLLYVKLAPWVRDFSGSEPAPTATPRESANNGSGDNQPKETPTEKVRVTATSEPDNSGGDTGNVNEADTNDNGAFQGDYQVTALEAVNLRSGPGTSFDIVAQINPGTALQYENDSQPATEPENVGVNWLKFTTEDGREGWIRDIDVGQT